MLAVLCAIPLTLLVRRYRQATSGVLGLAGVLYTIPALALMSLLWPIFGLAPATVIVALAIYALLVVLRNTLVALDQVPVEVLAAAQGMGMSSKQVFFRVQLPLAVPTIVAGIRIATVSTVGMVTIGAIVGYGGLGQLILTGFQQNFFHAQIATATIGCILLAVIFELLLWLTGRMLTPWAGGRTT